MQASVVLSTGSLLAACGGDDSSSSASGRKSAKKDVLKGLPVVALFTTLENDYYAGWDEGGRRAVEALGGKYRAFTNDNDPTKEVATFQNQVQAGAKIVFMTAPDPSNIPQIARIANDKKVYVVNTWESPEWYSPFSAGPYYVTYITNNSFEAGRTIAKALFEKMGGKGGLVQISGFPGSTPDWQRTEGMKEALKEYPEIKLLASQPGKWNRDDARNAMAGIIRKVGKDNIDGVFGQNDDCGVGAMNALQEAGSTSRRSRSPAATATRAPWTSSRRAASTRPLVAALVVGGLLGRARDRRLQGRQVRRRWSDSCGAAASSSTRTPRTST